MNEWIKLQSPGDSGGRGDDDPRESRERAHHASDQFAEVDDVEEITDPFYKDPALHVGEEVARSLRSKASEPNPKPSPSESDTGQRQVIRDAFTAEVPIDAESSGYDGASYGAQMASIIKDRQRESDSRPKGISASELEAIYAKRRHSDDDLEPVKITAKGSFSVWNIPGFHLLVKLLVVTVIILLLSSIQLDIVNEDGIDTTSPLPLWIYQQTTMSNEQQMLQRLASHERQFVLTIMRIQRVARAATRYELTFGTPPRHVEDLVTENLILRSRVTDGYGNFFRIENIGETIHVRSAGKDAAFHTDDDIIVVGDSTPSFSRSHYSRESAGTTLGD